MSIPTGTSTAAVNRFEALDGWRGVCACCVVLFHFHGYSPIYESPLVRNSYLFVDFFFVLSGFVIALNYATRLGTWHDLRRFLVLRLGRVYPLHVFMLFCSWLTRRLAWWRAWDSRRRPRRSRGDAQPLAVLSNLFLVQSLHVHDGLTWNGPSWSISTEVWTYVVFALVSVVLGLRAWMLALAAIAPPLALLYLSGSGMDVTYDWGLIRCIFGFALGIACYHVHRLRTRHGGPRLNPVAATVAECLIVAAVVAFVSGAGKSPWSLLAPFVFSVAVLVFAWERGAVATASSAPRRCAGWASCPTRSTSRTSSWCCCCPWSSNGSCTRTSGRPCRSRMGSTCSPSAATTSKQLFSMQSCSCSRSRSVPSPTAGSRRRGATGAAAGRGARPRRASHPTRCARAAVGACGTPDTDHPHECQQESFTRLGRRGPRYRDGSE